MRVYEAGLSLEELVRAHPVVILHYGSEACAPCHAIRNKIDAWLRVHPEVTALYVPLDKHVELAAQAGILSVPTVVAYVDGREALSETGHFSLDALLDRLERYLNMLT